MNLGMELIRMNLDMKLIFCMWLGIHKYIYLIQFIRREILNIKSAMCQDWIELNADFLHN